MGTQNFCFIPRSRQDTKNTYCHQRGTEKNNKFIKGIEFKAKSILKRFGRFTEGPNNFLLHRINPAERIKA